MAEKGPKKPLQDVPEDEIGSALDEALIANTRPAPGAAPKQAPVPPPAPSPTAVPVDPSTQWFLGMDDRQEGPFSIDQIREMVASGKADKDTLCWKPGLSDWLEIAHTPDLASLVVARAAPEPAPFLAASPAVSLSSLAQGELNVLARPREEPRQRAAAPQRASLLGALEVPELNERIEPNERLEPPEPEEPRDAPQSYRPRPPAPPAPTWADEPRRGATTYLMAGGGLVIVLLAAAVVFLVVRTPAGPVAPVEPEIVDAGAAVAQAPPIDAGLAAAVPDAGEVVPEEPPLSPEELAKLPESLAAKDVIGVVVADREALTGCVDAQQEADPEVSGKLMMRWTILPSGKTAEVQVMSKQFEGSTMAGCVTERIKGWRFPRHRKQGTPIDFPFKF